MGGPTFAMADHADHIHCGFTPQYGTGEVGKQFETVLKPDQWEQLIDRIGEARPAEGAAQALEVLAPRRARASGRATPTRASSVVTPASLFPFAQLDFAGSLGLDDGRYLVRSEGEASEVLIVSRRSARRRSAAGAAARTQPRRAAGRPGAAPADQGDRGDAAGPRRPRGGGAVAGRRGRRRRGGGGVRRRAPCALVNRALHAHGAAAQDPYVHEVSAAAGGRDCGSATARASRSPRASGATRAS